MPETSLPHRDLDVQTVVRVESKLRSFYDTLDADEQAVVDTLLTQAFEPDAEVAGFSMQHPLTTKGWTWFPSSPSFKTNVIPPGPCVPPDPCAPNPGQFNGFG